jgi:hypothetical protein
MAAARAIVLSGDDVEIDPSDLTDLPLWSAVEISPTPASNPLQAFSYSKGGQDPVPGTARRSVKTDTNLLNAGRMHDTEGMRVISLTAEYMSVGLFAAVAGTADDGYAVDRPFISMLDLKRLHCHTLVTFKIIRTTITSQLAGHFPTGPAIVVTTAGARRQEGPAALAAVDGFAIGVNGVPTLMGAHIFAIPHKINPTEEFSVDHDFPGGTVPGLTRRIFSRVFLRGPRRRAAR